jgi:hypothetical protein
MLVSTEYSSFIVRPPNALEVDEILRITGVAIDANTTYYVIESSRLNFVVAGSVTSGEDELEFAAPSTVMKTPWE